MSNIEESKKTMSYLIGYRMGSQMLGQMLPGIQAGDVNAEMLQKGILEGLAEEMDMNIVNEDVEQHQKNFLQMLQGRADERGQQNRENGRIYLEENAKKEGVTTTASGLQYEVMEAGSGTGYDSEEHGDAPTAEVMYKGTLIDGTVFDQSQQPIKFNIKQVIPGFTEALTLMPIGAKWRVSIPSDMAYGANGPGSIGPHSTLIFEMELISLSK